MIRKSELLRSRWKNYQKKYDYASEVDFDDVLKCIEELIKQLEFINI